MVAVKPSPARFARAVLDQAELDELVPWGDWLHLAWAHLGRTALCPADPLKAWRSLRRRTLVVLAELGAEVTVVRTDAEVQLDEHLADTAGLVRVTVPGVWPALRTAGDHPTDTWVRDNLGLTPALFPATLRGLCGQVSVDDERDPLSRTSLLLTEPSWDHPRAWLDAAGRPALTFDAAAATPTELADFGEAVSLVLPVQLDTWYGADRTPGRLVHVFADASQSTPPATWSPLHVDKSLRDLAALLALPALIEPFDPVEPV